MSDFKENVSNRFRLCMTVMFLLALLGLVAWIYELYGGLATTGMRSVISWGLYICCFAFFVKLSAGGLIVASSAEIFNIEALKPLARLGALLAAVCISLAALSLVPDLGRPERLFNVVLHPRLTSPMIWDVVIVAVYLMLAVTELRMMSTSPMTDDTRAHLRTLALVGLPAAFALHSITAWIFGLQISRTFWNTALMAPLFVISAIVSGTSLLAIVTWLLQKLQGVKVQCETWRKLSGLMAISLAIELFFLFSEYLTMLWANVPDEVATLRMLLPGGKFAALFWIEWVLGGALPLVLLFAPKTRQQIRFVVTSAGLIMVGVFAFQFELTTVGLARPLIELAPGNSLGTYKPRESVFQQVGQYSPTWVEYLIVLGLLAAGSAAVTLGYRHLGFKELSPAVSENSNLRKAAQA